MLIRPTREGMGQGEERVGGGGGEGEEEKGGGGGGGVRSTSKAIACLSSAVGKMVALSAEGHSFIHSFRLFL